MRAKRLGGFSLRGSGKTYFSGRFLEKNRVIHVFSQAHSSALPLLKPMIVESRRVSCTPEKSSKLEITPGLSGKDFLSLLCQVQESRNDYGLSEYCRHCVWRVLLSGEFCKYRTLLDHECCGNPPNRCNIHMVVPSSIWCESRIVFILSTPQMTKPTK